MHQDSDGNDWKKGHRTKAKGLQETKRGMKKIQDVRGVLRDVTKANARVQIFNKMA
jgi:hypothetical protein